MYNREQIEQWILDNSVQLDKDLEDQPKLPGLKEIYAAGCILEETLKTLFIEREIIREKCFAFGQRCFAQDPIDVLIGYLTELQQTGEIKDVPGEELADIIFKEQFKQEIA